MSPTPPSTNSSQGARSPEEQYRVVRKRNRIPLSCYPCRTRKKCDRGQPCSNCTKREGMGTSSCSYATPVSRKKNQSQGDSSPDDMQTRIDRLEGLVLSLMHGGANIDHGTTSAAAAAATTGTTHSTTTGSGSSTKAGGEEGAAMADEDKSDEDELASSLGLLKVDSDKGKSMYVGHQHWHTLLADIAEVKNYFNSHKKELETGYERVRSSKSVAARDGPTLLLGAVPASEMELRADLPSKSVVLTLCSRYFNSMDTAISIVHGPTFQKQLQDHWKNPSKTPIIWIGLVYSILTLAMISYHKVGDEPPEWKGKTMELVAEYRLRTVQCLIKSDYTKPVDYTIETMLLYIFGEYSARWDADVGLWLIMSIIIRIAYRMGYHRDAKWFPAITPYEAEMRRRTWALIRMADTIFSHQVSLPSMINENDCDTQLPNNFFDAEFYPGIKELPPSRPSTEPTPISYMISKVRLCNELGNILQVTNRLGKHVPYDEIIRYDAKLRQIVQELPPHLKLTPLEGSHDPVILIVARFSLDILRQKIMCLLHRKFLPRARQNARYAHSRRSAIEASMAALGHLSVLHQESQPNSRLRSVHWYVKNIATKDFVLPAMLIILDLHYDNMAPEDKSEQEGEGAFRWSQEERSRMIARLKEARDIWSELADSSMEAFKASKIIEIMLEKIHNPPTQGDEPQAPTADSMLGVSTNFGMDPSAAMIPGTMAQAMPMPDFNAGMIPPAAGINRFTGMEFGMPSTSMSDFQMDGMGANDAPSPFSTMFAQTGGEAMSMGDMGVNFDWNAFENYTQVANWGADQSFQIYTNNQDGSSPEQDGGGLNKERMTM